MGTMPIQNNKRVRAFWRTKLRFLSRFWVYLGNKETEF